MVSQGSCLWHGFLWLEGFYRVGNFEGDGGLGFDLLMGGVMVGFVSWLVLEGWCGMCYRECLC